MQSIYLLPKAGKFPALIFLSLFFVSAYSLNAPPGSGLPAAVAIGKFLNGSLPSTTPTGSGPVTWGVSPAFANLTFNDPLAIAMHPNENRMFVASRQGVIHHFVNDPGVTDKTLFGDLSDRTAVVWDGGFLGLTFHPEFGLQGSPNRNYLYTYYCAKGPNGESGPTGFSGFACPTTGSHYGTYLRLSRFSVVDGTLTLDPNSELKMINIRLYEETHRGGGLTFGNDGYLYLTIGDQARHLTAQNIVDNFEGGVIRIDVNQNNTTSHAPRRKMGTHAGFSDEISGVGYYVPNDNPWLSVSNAVFEEFWEIGHRAPHRMTMDKSTGELWIGEIGQNSREEVTVVKKGANAGWPVYEGNLYHNIGDCGSNSTEIGLGVYNAPVSDFLRSEANALIGGYVYRGTKYPSLVGKYICGDHLQNRIFVITRDAGGVGTKQEITSFTPGLLATFGQDHSGEIYLAGLGNNVRLYTLQGTGGGGQAPALLSQTGAFKNLQTLEPANGVIPYDMVEPFWSDGATKYRWMAIPNDGSHNTSAEQIQFSAAGNWVFPRGAVLIKHFELGGKRLETRFEVKGDDDNYYYLTYKWNSAGTDAQLLEGAMDETVSVGGSSQVWHYPSRTECQSCHQQAAGSVLGLKTRYLNSSIVYPSSGILANQLVTLSSVGILNTTISDAAVGSYQSVAAKNDLSRSVEDRARSYLDVNCSYCHQPGTGNRAGFDMRYTTPLDQQNLIYGALLDNLGISGARAIVPQEVASSMVHFRMNQAGTNVAMPPLAKNKVDAEGVALIANWINSLPVTPDPCANTTTTYLSDLNWVGTPVNGWGPVEKDRSNGETGATDGKTITINGQTYTKGLGAHAYAEIVYNVNSQYSQFLSDIGADDETCTSASIQFEVYGDNVLKYQSPVLTQADNALPVNVNIENVNQLKLIIRDGGNGIGCDHGDWAGARLVSCQSGDPVAANGTGLRGTYFDNINLTNEVLQRVDPTINFNWGSGSPAANIGADTYSTRWEGQIEAPATGNFTFYTSTDDGVRLWIDNVLIIDRWIDQATTEWNGTLALLQGREYDFRMEYYENGGGAAAQLSWSGPGIAKQVVPSQYLYPAAITGCSNPVASATKQDPTCGQTNGSIIFSFPDNPSQSTIEFSIDGGATYPYEVADNSNTTTIGNLAPGNFDLWVRWGNGQCPVNMPDLTLVNVNTNCPVACNTTVNSNTFESNWGTWIDGGSDAGRGSYPNYAASGSYCVWLRDNDPSSSFITTQNLNLSGYQSIRVEFSYITVSFDNSSEDFWLQISTNGGSSYTTKEEWNLNDEFVNNVRRNEAVTIQGPFTANTRLRFRCDASANDDVVYLDNITIKGCTGSGLQEVTALENTLVESCADGITNEATSDYIVTRSLPTLHATYVHRTVELDWFMPETQPFIGMLRVERASSIDGFFESLSEIQCLEVDQQTSNFVDTNPLKGSAFYRLKAIGADGINGVSAPVEVNYLSKETGLWVYPNPAGKGKSLSINIQLPQPGSITIQLYNLQGKKVREERATTGALRHSTNLSTQGLAAGAYILRVHGTDWQHVERVVLQ